MGKPQVAVVGGGITGLITAHRLAGAGFDVTMVEAGDRLGGQVRTEDFAGLPVDSGAEALHLAGPHLPELLDRLGLSDEVVRARSGSARIWDGQRLRPLPAGVGPTGPTRLMPVVRSRVMSPRGLARAAMEPLVGRSDVESDQSVGAFLDRRFGSEVVDRFVDPLLGNLHGGDVRRLSLQAVAPFLAQQASDHRSLILAARARKGGGPPAFGNFNGGLASLIDALTDHPGISIRVSTPVSALVVEPERRTGGDRTSDRGGVGRGPRMRYRLEGIDGVWDGVALAVPASVSARILAPGVGEVFEELDDIPTASVATVLAAFPRSTVEDHPGFQANGLLVTSRAGRLLKAATFLTRKWPHLDHPDHFVVRLSAGRARDHRVEQLDDDDLVSRLLADLAAATGYHGSPTLTLVRRSPGAMAQLEVGHPERLAGVRQRLTRCPGLALAGAAVDGLGIVSCTASADRAAALIEAHLADARGALVS